MKIKRGDTYQIKLYLEPGKISEMRCFYGEQNCGDWNYS